MPGIRPYGLPFGEPISITIANPGAGANATTTLVAGFNYLIMAFKFIVTTSVVAGTRIARVRWQEAGIDFYSLHMSPLNAVSMIYQMNWIAGAGINSGTLLAVAGTTVMPGTLPPNLMLSGGTIFGTDVLAMDAGDTITTIAISAQRFVA